MDADTNICAVILNYNDAQTTMKLTESWKNSKVIRNIIIVDNCSTDDSWEKLGEFKEEFASDHPAIPSRSILPLRKVFLKELLIKVSEFLYMFSYFSCLFILR